MASELSSINVELGICPVADRAWLLLSLDARSVWLVCGPAYALADPVALPSTVGVKSASLSALDYESAAARASYSRRCICHHSS